MSHITPDMKTGIRYLFSLIIFLVLFRAPPLSAECVKGNCVNGYGTFIWGNGCRYTGQWRKGKKWGHGTFTWPNGSRHTGIWKNGIPDGYGIYVSFYGITYKGFWKGEVISGKGTVIFEDGSVYRGHLKNGKRDGFGILYSARGRIIKKGIWRDDVFIGREGAR